VKDIIETLERWTAQGREVALGSVVERVGSAPRDPGATLALSDTGELAGGVTGGCVEPEVIREARAVLAGGRGVLRTFGLNDEAGFGVGLSCGGRIAVAVYRLDPALLAEVGAAVRDERSVAVTLRLDEERFGEQALVEFGKPAARGDLQNGELRALLELGESGIVENLEGGKLFVEPYPRRPDLYLFGASDHVAALVPLGRSLGYRVSVCDPRSVFLSEERFPAADALSGEWPEQFLEHAAIDARSAICMMTHDLKFDVPALALALRSPAGFIGAMGSEKVRAERRARLHELGVGDAELVRLHEPIGIQIGARSPAEVAVSIAAQLIESNLAARAGRRASLDPATVLS
jgi:xanthine dehydrogenase accessory factor